jgi:hypothetical protein
MGNKIIETTTLDAPVPSTQVEEVVESYDEIQNILDFEFNRPQPPKQQNPLGLDFDSIVREVLNKG